ncbi:MAG: uroporphyrinogen-III synthase [bacterium]
MDKKGKIYFIEVPSSSARLMPSKGLEILSDADIVIYNSGIDEDVISVNKKERILNEDYDKIKNLILNKVKEGKIIVYLKSGDLFIACKQNSEIENLISLDVPFEFIPCFPELLTSIYAGIPLLHSEFGLNFAFVCITEENGIKIPKDAATLVIYHGINNFNMVMEKVLSSGYKENTPAAVIKKGGSNSQEVITGNLGNITGRVLEKKINPPFLVIAGEVVGLRDKWRWFDNRPLFGRNIIVTRSQQQAGEFSRLLEDEGARVIEFPTIEIVPALNYEDLDKALDEIEKYHWIIFTSSNGVKYFFERVNKKGYDLRLLKGIKICAIGPGTAKAIENLGIKTDFIPKEFRAEGIVEGFLKEEIKGKNILIPRAEVAREILPERLEEMGANVNVATAYRTVKVDSGLNKIKPLLEEKEIDVITFTSFSTADNFISLFPQDELKDLMRGVNIASIGPITSNRIEKAGLKVKISPSEYTLEKLLDEIVGYYEKRKN